MSAAVEETEAIPEALAAGLLGMDASRRVGWAKAFEALRRVDALEEEVRQMRDERVALRRAYSRLLGFINEAGQRRSDAFDAELRMHYAAERSFRHTDAWEKGRAVGRAHLAQLRGWDEERQAVEKTKGAKKTTQAREALRGLFAAARDCGHLIDGDSGFLRGDCSCGESVTLPGIQELQDWKRDHAAQAAHGLPFAALEAIWKAERRAEEQTDGEVSA